MIFQPMSLELTSRPVPTKIIIFCNKTTLYPAENFRILVLITPERQGPSAHLNKTTLDLGPNKFTFHKVI